MALTLWSGVTLGAVYASVALGFTLSRLAGGIFNFAQGAIVALGAYLASSLLTGDAVGPWVAAVVLAAAGAALGAVCELVGVRPLRRRAPTAPAGQGELLATIGLSSVAVGAIGLIWGPVPRAVPFVGPTRPIHLLGVVARPAQVAVVLGATAAAAGLQRWCARGRWGQAVLAAGEDREAAALRGIDVDALSLAGFAAAGALGALSALAIGPLTYATPLLAFTLALGGFVAIALGGHGSFLGCLAGGLATGVASALATRYAGAAYANLTVLGLLVATLAWRPGGLVAPAGARHV